MPSPIVYLNGTFLPEEHAFIPVTDRGFLFGDGAFSTIKLSAGRLEFLEPHLQKLGEQCERLGIIAQKVSRQTIRDLINKNHAQNGVWRLKISISGGTHPGLNLERRSAGQVLITLKPYSGHVSPCKLTCYPYPVNYPCSRLKSLAYLDRLWIADYALKHGFDDALVCDHSDLVLESSFANVFWRTGKEMFYPDSSLSVYEGVTLQMLHIAAENRGLKVYPLKAKLEAIPDEAQFYLCNSLKGLVPVLSIDEKLFQRDALFERVLQEAYLELMNALG